MGVCVRMIRAVLIILGDCKDRKKINRNNPILTLPYFNLISFHFHLFVEYGGLIGTPCFKVFM